MGKFSASSIKGLAEMNLGNGLLNEFSKAEGIDRMEIVYLKIDTLIPNPKNEMSIQKIEELAQTIAMEGLDQPFVVRPIDNDRYILLAGHRRLEAIKLLVEQGKWKNEHVPCIVKDLDNINLPLSEDTKEDLVIIGTNTHRDKTEADFLFEARTWKKIYAELREAGVDEYVFGIDEKGNEKKQQIKGVKTKDLIAESMGISPAQVSKLNKIDTKGSDKLIQAVEKGQVSIAGASEIADAPKEEQEDIINKILDDNPDAVITAPDVKVFHQKQKKVKKEEKPDVIVNEKEFKERTKEIQDFLKQGDIYLTWKEYAAYNNAMEKVRKIIKKAAEE